jgi:hypothetical protein
MLRTAAVILVLGTLPAFANPVSFSRDWREQTFFRIKANQYALTGDRLGISSDGGVSVVYSGLPQDQWGKRTATWNWQVSRSVPATDLTIKGGDDRNVSMYFVFMDRASAERAGPRPKLRALLGNKNARMLVYTWGGKHKRGAVLPSPYLDTRGKTLVLRPTGTGRYSESVDLAADYARVFGGTPDVLVGIAVSSDSDDTETAVRADVSGLVLN